MSDLDLEKTDHYASMLPVLGKEQLDQLCAGLAMLNDDDVLQYSQDRMLASILHFALDRSRVHDEEPRISMSLFFEKIGCEIHLSLTEFRSKKSSYEIACLVDFYDDAAYVKLVRERQLKREQKNSSAQTCGFAVGMQFSRSNYESLVSSEGMPSFRLREKVKKKLH